MRRLPLSYGYFIWLFHVFFQMVRVTFLFSNGYYFLMDIVFNLIILNHPLPWLGLYHTNRNIPRNLQLSTQSLKPPPTFPPWEVPTIFGTHCREYHGTVPFQYNRICTSKSPNPQVDDKEVYQFASDAKGQQLVSTCSRLHRLVMPQDLGRFICNAHKGAFSLRDKKGLEDVDIPESSHGQILSKPKQQTNRSADVSSTGFQCHMLHPRFSRFQTQVPLLLSQTYNHLFGTSPMQASFRNQHGPTTSFNWNKFQRH